MKLAILTAAAALLFVAPANAGFGDENFPQGAPLYDLLECSGGLCHENDGWIHHVSPLNSLVQGRQIVQQADADGYYKFEQRVAFVSSAGGGWDFINLNQGLTPWSYILLSHGPLEYISLGSMVYSDPGVTREAQPDGSVLWKIHYTSIPEGWFSPLGFLTLEAVESGVFYKPRTTDDNSGIPNYYGSGADSSRWGYDESQTASCQALVTDAHGVNPAATDHSGADGAQRCPVTWGYFNTAKNLLVDLGLSQLRDVADLIDRIPQPLVVAAQGYEPTDLARGLVQDVRAIVQDGPPAVPALPASTGAMTDRVEGLLGRVTL